MNERTKALVQYLVKHESKFKKEAIVQTLLKGGYTKEEIGEAYAIYRHGGIHDSFFNKESFAKPKIKKRNNLGQLSMMLCVIPFVGFFYALWASREINTYHFPGREEAFFAIFINIIVTLIFLLIIFAWTGLS